MQHASPPTKRLWVCALLGIGLACATSATGRQQLILMPEDELSAMGQQAFASIKKELPVETDPVTNRYVDCVATAVLAELDAEPARWEVVVFASEQANAFALPGRKIGVYTGLLEVAKNQDQLAAVLAHEVAHVTQQHANERVSQAFLAQGGLAAASVALGGEGETHDLALAALGIGAQVGVLLPFSRAHESEADVVGLDYMARAGFDPRGAVALWRNMDAAGGAAPPEFLSTHPSHETRIEDLQAQLPSARAVHDAARSRGKAPRCSIDSVTSTAAPRSPHASTPALPLTRGLRGRD